MHESSDEGYVRLKGIIEHLAVELLKNVLESDGCFDIGNDRVR